MIDSSFLLALGILLTCGGLGAWAIGLLKYWGEREPYRGVEQSYRTSHGRLLEKD